ncbi:hypothetical protein L210DRAFT_934456 [Boletus edulis BED1]|uniref:Uncharacterized protein n=1 Tax=Boletus edulis BED1 TaxID=1328754 RepID=A0AAD4BTY6_BOLED|nr:hypothetical protein L210DRAFT_934456 [Boletus edulis BED1]
MGVGAPTDHMSTSSLFRTWQCTSSYPYGTIATSFHHRSSLPSSRVAINKQTQMVALLDILKVLSNKPHIASTDVNLRQASAMMSTDMQCNQMSDKNTCIRFALPDHLKWRRSKLDNKVEEVLHQPTVVKKNVYACCATMISSMHYWWLHSSNSTTASLSLVGHSELYQHLCCIPQTFIMPRFTGIASQLQTQCDLVLTP